MKEKIKKNKGIIDKELNKKLWMVTRKKMGKAWNEPTHGKSHIKKVYNNFISFINSKPKINKKVLASLECAVILHDIGRSISNNKEHGQKSIDLLKEETLNLPNKRWVLYAIKHHSNASKIFKEYKNEPKNNKECWLCLAFLVLLDHLDAIGEKGIKRAKEYLGKNTPLIPQSGPNIKLTKKENLKKWFNNPTAIGENRKDKSLLEHLCSNYYWIEPNVSRVRKRLKQGFKEKYKKRGRSIEKYLFKIIPL